MRIKVFFCDETDKVELRLRRFEDGACDGRGYHNAHSETVAWDTVPPREYVGPYRTEDFADTDPRWPAKCDHCDHRFTPAAEKQVWADRILRRADTGEEFRSRERPVGSVIDAWWGSLRRRGPDGRCLSVMLPGNHDWMIDSRASNCTMPEEHTHRCWVRHGSPEEGNLHVDKNGHTCAAGAGSIAIPGFHGFLHKGELYDC